MEAVGTVLLEAEHVAACHYPITAPQGIRISWLSRAEGETLADATLAARPAQKGAKLWFAGERDSARLVREAAKASGWAPGDLHVSEFWTAKK